MGTALSYDITESRVESSVQSADTAAHETASLQLRRDEHLPPGDDDHLMQTFGSPSQISPACPTRAAPTAAAFPSARSRVPATPLHSAFHPHCTLANVLGHLVSRSWDEVWTMSAIGAGPVAAPTPPRRKLPTTAHHARYSEGSHHQTLVPWDIALSPASRVCGSLTIFFPVGQVDS